MICLTILSFIPIALLLLGSILFLKVKNSLGDYVQEKSASKRARILQIIEQEEKEWESTGKGRRDSEEWETVEGYSTATPSTTETLSTTVTRDSDWDGVVGFFHPFCNAGGGGERVLWAGIRAIQVRWPKARCVVYTGDRDVDKKAILTRVQNSFNINIHPPTVVFLYLSKRSWVLASSWPHFTLLGQSLGSLVLAWDAFSLLVPDIFIDTMGYAFSLAFCKFLFPKIPTGAYVHYPTISTDMLSSLTPGPLSAIQGVNGGKGFGILGLGKRIYWKIFAKIYSFVGGSIDIVMTNSTWTQEHIVSIWGPWRSRLNKAAPLVIFPPVAVEELVRVIDICLEMEKKRHPILLYVGQFRPEKNHRLILQSFAKFKSTSTDVSTEAKLVFVGSVRDSDDSNRVTEYKALAHELGIKDSVVFHLDATWPEVIDWLGRASIGVNGMWNEHFGIGVVEYQAAGLIPVVHNSGGPRRDIVRTLNGEPTGYHANTAEEYAACYETILSLNEQEKLEMRKRSRKNTERFTEEIFMTDWIKQIEILVEISR